MDAHSTLGLGVVVQVSGELSNNGQPMRRFMQTFVLAPQSPKKYYVHNDIFRYQDEVYGDDEASPPPPQVATLVQPADNSVPGQDKNVDGIDQGESAVELFALCNVYVHVWIYFCSGNLGDKNANVTEAKNDNAARSEPILVSIKQSIPPQQQQQVQQQQPQIQQQQQQQRKAFEQQQNEAQQQGSSGLF